MTLFSYEIFDAVARQGSFNKAAQQLHLTPSAISHAIAVMEEELGFALFNRGKNGVSMTSYGASLYPSIRDVLNSDEALKQSIARLNGLEKGKVKLGVFNSVCASLLPGLLKSFAAHYPQIEIEVYQGTYDDVKEWLRTGQVDIAFLSSTCREEFNLTELFREPLLCIVPQDWPEPQDGVMPRHRRPVQHCHGGGRAWHLHHAADAAAGLQSRRQGVPHRAGGVPRGGSGRAAPGLYGSRRGADVPPYRGVLPRAGSFAVIKDIFVSVNREVLRSFPVFVDCRK